MRGTEVGGSNPRRGTSTIETYNTIGPHRSLGMMTPAAFSESINAGSR